MKKILTSLALVALVLTASLVYANQQEDTKKSKKAKTECCAEKTDCDKEKDSDKKNKKSEKKASCCSEKK